MNLWRLICCLIIVATTVSVPSQDAQAQSKVDRNIVYGMHFGTALLLDAYHPEDPNGYGIVLIEGSGFHALDSYDALPLKEGRVTQVFTPALLRAGYTVFSMNHRAAPQFRYPAAVEDAQRAVRYIRHNAAEFGIDPERIGAIGMSSGAHLAGMLGVLDGDSGSVDISETGQESSKVQAVVLLCPATDLQAFALGTSGAKENLSSFLGALLPGAPQDSPEAQLYRQASVTTYVTPDDPPILLMHGDADMTVPYEQSVILERALREAGVTTELLTAPGANHMFLQADGSLQFPAVRNAVDWFERYLKN